MARRPDFDDLISDYKDAGKTPWNGLKVMVLDPKTGSVLVNAGGELPHDPASLTKLMTFYIAQRAVAQGLVSLDDTVAITKRVPYAKVERGDKLTLDTALKAMMTASDNGVSQAIADMIQPKIHRDFVAHANATAERLGMDSTHFSNAHGLPAKPKNTTTAHDMARLMRQIYTEFPDNMSAYMGTNNVNYDGRPYRAHHDLNRHQSPRGLPKDWEACAKTGYTNAARHNIASLITDDSGKQLIVVVMGAGWTSRQARIDMDVPVGHSRAAKGSEVRDALATRLAEHFLDDGVTAQPARQVASVPAPSKSTEMPVTSAPKPKLAPAASNAAADNDNTWPHTIKSGENLARIAERYGVSVADIVASNALANPSHLLVGKTIQIPHVASYRVQAGDTLSEIAERFATTTDMLKQMNGTERDTVVLGRRMAIPAVVGMVAKGSNLFDTARTVMENSCDAIDYTALRQVVYSMNDRDNDVVREGQALFFPRQTTCKAPTP